MAFAAFINMVYRLTSDVKVRKESWGLLFYSQTRHRLFLVRSGDWFYPHHFEQNWNYEKTVDDIIRRTGASLEVIERSFRKMIANLEKNGMINHEL